MIFAWIIFSLQKDSLKLLYKLNNKDIIKKIFFGSFVGTFLALSFWIIGYANIDKPPIASIIGQTSVIFITILSWLILKEKISVLRIISMFVAISGVILITIK